MTPRVNKKIETHLEKSRLSIQDVHLLLIVCTELVDICAKFTGKIDSGASAMLAHVRDRHSLSISGQKIKSALD
jgi:hypothetical protein